MKTHYDTAITESRYLTLRCLTATAGISNHLTVVQRYPNFAIGCMRLDPMELYIASLQSKCF
jgi:hypothetical protein